MAPVRPTVPYSSLGLCGNWERIAVIDTENHSSELYAHLGNYKVLHIEQPFTPERYMQAIQICEQAQMEVIIIDSLSHEWEGLGGILSIHSNMTGNSYTNWNKLTPKHNSFVQHILQSPAHIIGTIRAKQEYILSEKNGKQVPEKVGMKGVTREGMDYEFTLVFELNMKNSATASKDRTSLFFGKPEFQITQETGGTILNWCNEPPEPTNKDIMQRINECKSLAELLELYNTNPNQKDAMTPEFTKKRQELILLQKSNLQPQNFSNNGTNRSK